jgi:protein-disulfide isomerase
MVDLLIPEDTEPRRKRHLFRSIFGWLVFLLLFAWVIFVGTRVWYYYDKIRRGEIVQLPQFAASFTPGKSAFAGAAPAVERAAVESKESASLGPDEPQLTIVEFADFECPYSKEASAAVRTLAAKYKDRVRFEFREFPLEDVHTAAMNAAVAAECAKEQGKFWAFHDKMFVNQKSLGFADLLKYGEQVGLQTDQFQKCLVDNRYAARVAADLRAGKAAGVRGTPTFFLNGNRVEGAIPPEIFEQVIEKLLQ